MIASPRILVHSPRKKEADDYASLIRRRDPGSLLITSTTESEAQQRIRDAEILVGWFFPASIFANAPNLRWVHKVSAGVDDVASNPLVDPRVVLTRTDGALIAPRMIEYVLGAIFAIVQHFPRSWAQQRERKWQSFPVGLARGSTVGVAGLGDIGTEIARALQLNGMHVIGWRRTRTESSRVERLYVGHDELLPFVTACDFVVVVLPATIQTRNLLSHEVFAAMKPSAWLINVGRGAVVDENALVVAIGASKIAGAVLDVFAEEPLSSNSPLWDLSNVLVTPHVSGPILPEDVVGCFLENLQRYRHGKPLLRRVDRNRGY